jgi:hypothetical protein
MNSTAIMTVEESPITTLIAEFANGTIGLQRGSDLQISFSIKYESLGARVYNVQFLLNGDLNLRGYNMEGKLMEIDVRSNHADCLELLFPNDICMETECLPLEHAFVTLSLQFKSQLPNKMKRKIHFDVLNSVCPHYASTTNNEGCSNNFGAELYNTIQTVEQRKRDFECSVRYQEIPEFVEFSYDVPVATQL